MKMTSRASVKVQLLHDTNEVAELAKFAMKAGFDFALEGDDDEDLADSRGRPFVAILDRDDPAWLQEELAWLVYLQALGSNQTPNEVLEAVRVQLQALQVTMGLPPMDAAGIGNPPANEPGG